MLFGLLLWHVRAGPWRADLASQALCKICSLDSAGEVGGKLCAGTWSTGPRLPRRLVILLANEQAGSSLG